MKQYILKPNMTFTTVVTHSDLIKPPLDALNAPASKAQDRVARELTDAIAPMPAAPTPLAIAATTIPAPTLPARQPLPTPVLYPDKPSLKLGLDVHLEFIMAVAQRDHAAPQAPRKFTPDQLVVQVRKWIAEGCVVYTVQI